MPTKRLTYKQERERKEAEQKLRNILFLVKFTLLAGLSISLPLIIWLIAIRIIGK